MSSPLWTLSGNRGNLSLPGHRAMVDAEHPEHGLHVTRVAGHMLPRNELLGVQLSALAAGEPVVLIEAYGRGADLIATYAETPSQPARVQIYWRVIRERMPRPALWCVDLQVSVQTNLLDLHPQLDSRSRLPVAEVLRLAHVDVEEFEPLSAPPGATVQLSPDDGTGCLLLRTAESDLSYVEMVYPSDFAGSAVRIDARDGTVQVTQRLFAESLEKGVIRRARIRGAYLSRDGDVAAAAQLYREFVAEPPPLTT